MKLITTLFLFALPCITFSQTIIKGSVSDHIGPLAGANIIIKDTRLGTVSDVNGNYEIEAEKTDTLLISYLGYETEAILVASNTSPKTVLNGNIILDEVHVVAYGTSRTCRYSCCGYTIYETCINFKSDVITEKLYPNPSKNGQFKLSLLKSYKSIQVQVNGISGKLIKTFNYKNENKELNLDLSPYPSGIYIINIIADGERLEAKKAIIG